MNATREPELHASVIKVTLDLIDEYNAPTKILGPHPDNPDVQIEKVFTFTGDRSGTAEEKLIEWAHGLPLQLALMADSSSLDGIPVGADAPARPSLDIATKATLRVIAKKYGLNVSGNVTELRDRIRASEQYQADQAA